MISPTLPDTIRETLRAADPMTDDDIESALAQRKLENQP